MLKHLNQSQYINPLHIVNIAQFIDIINPLHIVNIVQFIDIIKH